MNDESDIYLDAPSYPPKDPRELNVKDRIAEVQKSPKIILNEDPIEANELANIIKKCNSISSNSDNDEIPTAKAVYTLFNSIQNGNEEEY